MSGRGRGRLRLITGDCPVPAEPINKRAISAQRLSMRVVDAAQQWAAEVLADPAATFDPGTAEGRARIRLLDAVHDLEYHQANPMGTGRLGDEPGGP